MCTWKLARWVNLKYSHHKKETAIMWDGRGVSECKSGVSFGVYKCITWTPCVTLNLICYILIKAGKSPVFITVFHGRAKG